ncbi:MAG TPA: DegT/DnrJ/EryC1/StrS family aminotransferase [Cyclobacteriaceae bacterium]
MKDIKMVDLQSQYLRIKSEIDQAIQTVLHSTAFIQGPQVNTFAEKLSNYIGGAHVVTCANGTDALQIAMMALELKAGDEIILPVHTYVATAEVIALLGLIPVFVDVEETTFNIDVNQIEAKITSKTKVIIPVHLYGQCADMERIMTVARKHNLYVIEDTAQALGSQYKFSDGAEKRAGTIGTIGTTSFFPSKNLGCFGDGGAIFSSDELITEKMRMIANHGQKVKYHHDLVGINSRLDTLQAAILDVKLNYLNEYESKRNEVANFYDSRLAGISSIRIPLRAKYSTHVFHQYTLRAGKRDELKIHLAQKGIPTMVYYPVPLHLQKAYKRAGNPEGSFPITERLSKEVISLPIHTEMNEHELDYICQSIKDFYHD